MVDELLPADVPLVGPGEGFDEETHGQRGVLSAEQGPPRVVLAQCVDGVEIHGVLGAGAVVSKLHGGGDNFRGGRRAHPPGPPSAEEFLSR